MIVILIIFIILIVIVALSKNYFIGSVVSDNLLFSNGNKSINPDLSPSQNTKQSLINTDLCITLNSDYTLYNSTNMTLQLKKNIPGNANKVNNNYKFKFLNVSSNDEIVIYHPETNSYIYSMNNKITLGQLNILKPEQLLNAKFKLLPNTNTLNKFTFNNKNTYLLQHINTGLYLANEDLSLSDKSVGIHLTHYSTLNKNTIADGLITDIENFNVDRSEDKRTMCSMARNGLVPSSLIPCNLKDDIETFNSESSQYNTFDFNIFQPHIKMDYQNLFKSYGENLYNDNIESVDGTTTLDYLKNYHMSLLNKNNQLQTYIDIESLKLENLLDTKLEDLELIKLNKDSTRYYNLKGK